MVRTKSHFQSKEPVLEWLLRYLRYRKISPYIKDGAVLLDLGCGYNALFLERERSKVKKSVGIDWNINQKISQGKILLLNSNLNGKFPLKSNSFDQVSATAILEHVENPGHFLKECQRVLRSGGELLITTPCDKWMRLLKFLAKLSFLSRDEINDHKNYFNQKSLKKILMEIGFVQVRVESFECGMNLFAQAKVV